MKAPATADAVAVLLALWWMRGASRRATLRSKLDGIKAANPTQYAAAVKAFPDIATGHEQGESLMVPLALAGYVALRSRR